MLQAVSSSSALFYFLKPFFDHFFHTIWLA
jgi:hypothetical protein